MTGATVVRRTAVTGAVLLALVSSFVTGLLVARAGSGESPAYRLAVAGLDRGWSCARLRQWYVDHGVEQVTAWGWQPPIYARAIPLDGAGPLPTAPGSAVNATALDTHTGSSTGTNVQEASVDEPDLVKTAGGLLVRISDGSLETYDVSGVEPRRLGVAPLGRVGDPQLLLSGGRVVVIGSDQPDPTAGAWSVAPPPRTRVLTYDVDDPSSPTLLGTRVYDGSVVAARQVGSVVRLVLDDELPQLDFVQPSSRVTQDQALEHNRQVVRDTSVTDWLPRVTTYADGRESSAQLVDCADVSVPATFGGLDTVTVVGIDPAEPGVADATALASSPDTAYMSPTHLYVASSPWSDSWRGFGLLTPAATGPTRIYGFDLSGTSTTYVGMGSVTGLVAGSWSMDEHDGVLRVAVTGSGATSLVMLRPESGRLVDVGRVAGLGLGQQLKSVRWFDDLAVLVTFRQTDPFYVVDVHDPADPRVLGELHLPGWSSYLHPVGPHLVLGLGQTASSDLVLEAPRRRITVPPTPVPTPPAPNAPELPKGSPEPVRPALPITPMQRAKATLFDISDLTHPRQVGTVSYPAGSVPMAATDPHQVTWLPDQDTLLTVIGHGFGGPTYDGDGAWLSVLTVRDGTLQNRLLRLPAAVPVTDVRTAPLADGRAVLVAGDLVEFVSV